MITFVLSLDKEDRKKQEEECKKYKFPANLNTFSINLHKQRSHKNETQGVRYYSKNLDRMNAWVMWSPFVFSFRLNCIPCCRTKSYYIKFHVFISSNFIWFIIKSLAAGKGPSMGRNLIEAIGRARSSALELGFSHNKNSILVPLLPIYNNLTTLKWTLNSGEYNRNSNPR